MEVNLKRIRTEILGLTQVQLAALLSDSDHTINQDQISRWESNPDSIEMWVVDRIARKTGIMPDQLFRLFGAEYEDLEYESIRIDDPFIERDLRIRLLDGYCTPTLDKFARDESAKPLTAIVNLVAELERLREFIRQRPLLATVGGFDSGKSTLLNALIGVKAIPAKWTPATPCPIYIAHIAHRPSFMSNASVFAFKAPVSNDSNTKWDFRRLGDESHFNEWYLDSGGYELLERYAVHRAKSKREDGDARAGCALLFVDAPILKACDLVDTPGYGSAGKPGDEVHVDNITREADAFILLSKTNGFMDDKDLRRLSDILRRTPVSSNPNNGVVPFGRILIVGSQADFVPSQVDGILDQMAVELYDQIPESVISQIRELGGTPSQALFRTRFTSYSTRNTVLRRDFEAKLSEMLLQFLAPTIISEQEHMVVQFQERSVGVLDNEIRRVNSVLQQYEATKSRLVTAKANRPKVKAEMKEKVQDAANLLHQLKNDSVSQIAEWWNRTITPDSVDATIRSRGYSKKDAQQYIAGNMIDSAKDHCEYLLKSKMEDQLKPKLDALFKEYRDYAARDFQFADSATGAEVPFDFEGALAGALAGASVLGGLAIWASTLGNLGWYIIAAKGVSLLSALGISVGGTAAAAAWIAALGGPLVFAAALAVLIGMGIAAIFGKSWQRRLAEKLCEELSSQNIHGKLSEGLVNFWNDTDKGLHQVVDELEKQYDRWIHEMEELLASHDDPEKLQSLIKKCEEYRRFFAELPWKPLDAS